MDRALRQACLRRRTGERAPLFHSLCAILLVAIYCTPLLALDPHRSINQFAHRSWGERDGAPSMLRAMAQTSDGYLWLGGTSGVVRFDGVRFEQYLPQSGGDLPRAVVNHLLALPDGKLWIGWSGAGVSLLENGRVTNYNESSGLPDRVVVSLVQDQDGSVWASTLGGLARFDGRRWEPIGKSWDCPASRADGLFVDSRGTLWVAIHQTVLYLPRGSHHFERTGDYVIQGFQFAEAPDGKVWLADTGSAVRPVGMPGSERTKIAQCIARNPEADEKSDPCHSASELEIAVGSAGMLFDRDHVLWASTIGDGIIRVPSIAKLGDHRAKIGTQGIEHFAAKDGLSADFAVPIMEDREGSIWVGTRDGLDQFRDSTLTPVAFPSGSTYLSIKPSSDGELWVTDTSNSISLVGGHDSPPELHKTTDRQVRYSARDDLYFYLEGGVFKVKDGRLRKVAGTPDGVVGLVDVATVVDARGVLWAMVGNKGFFYLDGTNWLSFDTPPDLARLAPLSAYADPSGRLWFGTDEGRIITLDHGKIQAYGDHEGLHLGAIKAIFEQNGHLWVGGSRGLELLDGQTFRDIIPADSSRFGAVSGIVDSPANGLWLTETRGILQIPEVELRKVLADTNYRPQYRVLGSLDGLPGLGQQSPPFPTAVRGTDGRLWFATSRGVAWVDPDRRIKESPAAPVYINSLVADGKEYVSPAGLRLSSRTIHLEIKYTALSLSIPERVKFRYRLDGLDSDWQDGGNRREADYSQLRPGRYTFHVIACNSEGVWNETGATLEFVVTPTFTQTLLFKLLCGLAGLILIWCAYRLRLRSVSMQLQERLGAQMEERERIARELHDTLLQGFQGLMLRLQAVMKTLPQQEPAHQMMEKVMDRADEVLQEGRQRVRELRAEGMSGNDLIQALTQSGEELAQGHDALFSLSVVGTPQMLNPIVCNEAYRIAQEAISNAFRHSNGSKIEVEVTYSSERVSLRIRDNGQGMSEDILASGRAGHWGLSGMRERANKIAAQLSIWTQPNTGTEVDLSIPSKVAYFQSNREPLWKRLMHRIGS